MTKFNYYYYRLLLTRINSGTSKLPFQTTEKHRVPKSDAVRTTLKPVLMSP